MECDKCEWPLAYRGLENGRDRMIDDHCVHCPVYGGPNENENKSNAGNYSVRFPLGYRPRSGKSR